VSALSLVLGCGYVGEALAARLRASGKTVLATSRRADRLDMLAKRIGSQGLVFDPTQGSPARLLEALQAVTALDVWCLLTPQALASEGVRRDLFDALASLPLNSAVLSSSTGIYGPVTDAVVDETTPPILASPREQRLAAIESDWLRLPHARVARLAGLYGPGRLIGAASLREAAVLPGAADAWLNLIHREDAAELLARVATHPAARAIELGTDGTPLRRREYYGFLASLLSAAPPRFEQPTGGDPGKRIDAAATARRLDFQPRYADFKAGLRAALAAG
jgi:nucleoside-diphosphate-sugar epimerase